MSEHKRIFDSKPKRVLAAMSGGVDSSVTALLLQREGYCVEGATMSLVPPPSDSKLDSATNTSEANDAAIVCTKLGIPFHLLHFEEQFQKYVIQRFCNEYLEGRTPNPCIDCNLYIKFGLLQEYSQEQGFDYLATGHYARCNYNPKTDRWELLAAADTTKDQSYFLSRLTQDQLAHALFPLGNLSKTQVRTIAQTVEFPNAQRKESQDICFVPTGNYADVLTRFAKSCDCNQSENNQNNTKLATLFEPGSIADEDGNILGVHNGLALYTIGQRKGIGVAAPEPLYVLRKIPEENMLVVGPARSLLTREVHAENVNFVSLPPEIAVGHTFQAQVKTLYRQQAQPAEITYVKQESKNQDGSCEQFSCFVEFENAIKCPASGQTLCVYHDQTVQSSGKIV